MSRSCCFSYVRRGDMIRYRGYPHVAVYDSREGLSLKRVPIDTCFLVLETSTPHSSGVKVLHSRGVGFVYTYDGDTVEVLR